MTAVRTVTDWTKFLAYTVPLGALLAAGLAGALIGSIFTFRAVISGDSAGSIGLSIAVAVGGIVALAVAICFPGQGATPGDDRKPV